MTDKRYHITGNWNPVFKPLKETEIFSLIKFTNEQKSFNEEISHDNFIDYADYFFGGMRQKIWPRPLI